MFYVYVLKSDKGHYIGYTEDLKRRLKEHNSGKGLYTKRSSAWKVIYYEAHTSEIDAKRREHYLKSSNGGMSLKRMLREALSEK